VKVSREISVGDRLQVRQGWDERTVLVTGLSDQRRGAPEASRLYEETAESIERREAAAAARRAAGGMIERPASRPTKKQRRQIHRFRDSS
jgi:ribosome-associated heat shock protein Hsp15